ncbi:hypothetical protein [Catenulispora rubra]|uniref:hypothetical protein n=1 Tax=Catenulispora rubra TaxID=280293 RepID=UPI0018920547|nr:hypothetical protein [Catenulispora rubra]
MSTLGDWQHGNARPASVPAVHALEKMLGLPHQALSELIPRIELSERSGALGELLDQVPGARDRNVDVLSRQDRAWADEAGRIWRITSRVVLRARRDGVDRYILRYFADAGSVLSRIDVEAVANCTVGQVRWRADAPVIVAELCFGQRLRAGETWLLEYRWTNPTGESSTVLAHAVRHRLELYTLELVFDPAAPPAECHAFTQTDYDEPIRPTAALELNTHHTVHLIGTPLLTGLHGIRWRLRD